MSSLHVNPNDDDDAQVVTVVVNGTLLTVRISELLIEATKIKSEFDGGGYQHYSRPAIVTLRGTVIGRENGEAVQTVQAAIDKVTRAVAEVDRNARRIILEKPDGEV